jgi:hypothetical protein
MLRNEFGDYFDDDREPMTAVTCYAGSPSSDVSERLWTIRRRTAGPITATVVAGPGRNVRRG